MNPRGSNQGHHALAFLLGACVAVLAHAMPGGEASAQQRTEPTQRTEPLACLVFDEQAPARLKLSADQTVEWQRLQQLHEQLFGDRCQAPEQARTTSALPARQQAAIVRAMQIYRKDFLDFLGGLTSEQRVLLEDAARARQNARAGLEQKVILHRLML